MSGPAVPRARDLLRLLRQHAIGHVELISEALTAAEDRGRQSARDAVLAIHRPTEVWTDSTVDVDDSTGETTETQNALYDDAGGLVYAPDVHTVCEGCDIRNGVPWPCPTARAVGATA